MVIRNFSRWQMAASWPGFGTTASRSIRSAKSKTSRHLGFGATGSRSIRSAVPENPTLGSNAKSIGRSVPEIWPFQILNLMTSLMTSQGPDTLSVKKNYFRRTLNRKEQLRHRAVSLRQHGFLVKIVSLAHSAVHLQVIVKDFTALNVSLHYLAKYQNY